MTSSLAIIAIITMLILAFGIIFFVVLYQRRVIRHQQELKAIEAQKELELIQASLKGEENERDRIASELHDDVGATLASVKLFLHSQNEELGDKPVFIQSRDLIDETINKVRNISHRLQPSMLKQLGLRAALTSFFDSYNRSGTFHIHYHNQPLPRLTEDTELGLYRIVQELVNNMVKHSGATQAVFVCYNDNGQLIAELQHNGDGLTEATFQEYVYKKNAIGLKNILNRLKAINGNITFGRTNDMYTTSITIPYEQDKVHNS